jgi:hypothetical protein
MTPADELEQAFTEFRSTAFRLETLAVYADDQDHEDWVRFLAGDQMTERSPETEPWLKRVAETSAAGKQWRRVHVVGHPLSTYLQFEFESYPANVAAGEDVRIADSSLHPELLSLTRDFWLFDDNVEAPFVLLLHFDGDHHLRDAERTADPLVVQRCRHHRDLAVERSIPFGEFLATKTSWPRRAVR